jgi:1-acyl-sn-glycerol-3-phosphate acyltransferase
MNIKPNKRLTADDESARVVLNTVRRFVAELRARPEADINVTLDSSLERDLGIDSLARVELFTRLERDLGVGFSEKILAGAETPRDLLRAMLTAGGVAPSVTASLPRGAAPEWVEKAPDSAETLLDVLDWHVRSHPQRAHIILIGESGEAATLDYENLQQGAAAIAAGLLEADLRPGQAAAIMLPTSEDYFYCFFGVLLAGGVPVPIYPPARVTQIEDHLRRHAGILANALAAVLITVPEAKGAARLLKAQVETLRTVATPRELSHGGATAPGYAIKAQDAALLQYTSGSTGNPKGVVLTHANLLANIRAMGRAAQVESTDVFVSWLPLYHDMGLIGAWLGSLYYAYPLVVMSPLAFLARPERWLWAIHRYRGTLAAAPNFGYELCLRKIADEALAGLDLSSWRMAFNGAEPVSAETVTRFSERFARYGLRPNAMAPVYGLAECAVGLAFPPPDRGVVIDRIARDTFMRTGRAEAGEGADVLRIVACGRPLPGHQIRIVDGTGRELGERVEGRLQFRGPSATAGYYRNPQQNSLLFHGDWLDSGDYAYMAGGDVYLTGRAKDVIIRAGRNIYPYELEEAVGNIPGIRKGCVAVFASPDPAAGTERLIVMAEMRETDPKAEQRLRERINTVTLDVLGMPADDIALVPVHTVLKTSSGKIRRAACRELYERGRRPPRAVWWQIARLAWAGTLPQLRRAVRVTSDVLYAAYTWALFWLIAPPTWLAAALSPRPKWSWAASRAGARLFVRLAAAPFEVRGLEHVPRDAPSVLVANHASYLDGIIVVAALPGALSPAGYFSFVAKRELLGPMVPRVYLKRIGAMFVERIDPQRGVEDVRHIVQSVRAGHSTIFFPEGTFTRVPGLLPFRMGAFTVAAESGVPVVPVSIRGTRSILRDGQWLPRRGAVVITIGPPLIPEGTDWAAAVRLRDAARAEISRRCGEPDLAPQPHDQAAGAAAPALLSE